MLTPDEIALMKALERNRTAGRDRIDAEPSTEWIERLSPSRRSLAVARYLVTISRDPADILPRLDDALGSDDADDVFEAMLLRGNLLRATGDHDGARDAYRAAFAVMGWTPPMPEAYGRAAGLGIGLSAARTGAVLEIDGLIGIPDSALVRAEIDDLLARGLLLGGGFYDHASETRTAGRCDKRRAEVLELIDRDREPLAAVRALIQATCRVVLAANYFEGAGLYPLEFQIAAYGPGAVYDAHADTTPGTVHRRALTLIHYPNPGWEPSQGGLLRIEAATGTTEVEPANDRLVVFDSDAVHQVTECFAERRSVTCWCWASRV